MTEHISAYITLDEYSCNCGNCNGLPPMVDNEIYHTFFDDFSVIRSQWGKPINISSGYRCPEYNHSIGGSLLSVHIFGLALDCNVASGEVDDLDVLIEDVAPHLRRGKYTEAGSFIHCDAGFEIYPRPKESFIQGYRWNG